MNTRLKLANTAIKKAGRIVKKGFNETSTHQKASNQTTKHDANDILTEYDTKSQDLIIKHIKKTFPKDEIIAEEIGYDTNPAKTAWVIDPIDGTNPFSRGIHTFAIVIGYMINFKAQFCVVFNPVLNELYVAEKGKGATRNGEPIQINYRPPEQMQLNIEGFSENQAKVRYKLSKSYFVALGNRSAAFSMIQTAKGSADGFVADQANIWDRVHYIIAQEAGAKVTDFAGKPYTLKSTEQVIAHPKNHKKLVQNVMSIADNL